MAPGDGDEGGAQRMGGGQTPTQSTHMSRYHIPSSDRSCPSKEIKSAWKVITIKFLSIHCQPLKRVRVMENLHL